jgi:hypothetical protein
MTEHSLWIVMMSVAIGCGSAGTGGVGTGEGTVYTLDLQGFGTTQNPGGLAVANQTLAFPLALGPTEQFLSPADPGDLVVASTRVGCSVDPEAWIGTNGVVPIQVPRAQPVALTEVTIDQFVGIGVTATPRELAERSCLTFRSEGGQWMPFFRPEKITLPSTDSVRAEFVIDA